MLVCKGDLSFKCSKLKTNIIGATQCIQFSILDSVFLDDVKNLFVDNTFYFYDDVIKGRLPDTNNTKLVGLRITYNADSIINITIKLTKGVVDNES